MIKILFSDSVSIWFNLFIFVSGLVVFICLLLSNSKFVAHAKKYSDEAKKRKDDATVDTDLKNGIAISDNFIPISDVFMEDYQEEYDQLELGYKFWSQLISIFPMLGILGTVVGLMKQINSEGLEQMTGSIGLALGTTFAGLVVAVILKITDNFVSNSSDKIMTIITKHDRKYHHSTTKKMLEKE